jgi:hypothetical protein
MSFVCTIFFIPAETDRAHRKESAFDLYGAGDSGLLRPFFVLRPFHVHFTSGPTDVSSFHDTTFVVSIFWRTRGRQASPITVHSATHRCIIDQEDWQQNEGGEQDDSNIPHGQQLTQRG